MGPPMGCSMQPMNMCPPMMGMAPNMMMLEGMTAQNGMAPQNGNGTGQHNGQNGNPPPRRLTMSLSDPADPNWLPDFTDNDKKMCSSYRALGLFHIHGNKKCAPKKFRASLMTSCDHLRFAMLKLVNLDDEGTDLGVFCCSGVLPNVRPSDFGVNLTKGMVRRQIRQLYLEKHTRNPQRLALLSEELDNLPMVAMRAGYPVELLTPHMRETWDRCRQQFSMMQMAALDPTGGQQHRELASPSATSPQCSRITPSVPQLTDGLY